MRRKLIYSGLVAGLMCGCQSTRNDACCDNCVPPKSCCSYGYGKWHDKVVTQATSAFCAKDDLKQVHDTCGKRSKHFDQGFYDAYADLAQGRLAQVPPVPPRQYWSAYYRSCAGAEDVADWFGGYRVGLEYGARGGVSQFDRIATSWDGSGTCLYPGGGGYTDVIPTSADLISQTPAKSSATGEASMAQNPTPSGSVNPQTTPPPTISPQDRYQMSPTSYRP